MGLYYHHSNNFSWRALIIWIALVITIIMMFIIGIFGVGCPLEEYEALLEFKASCNGTSPSSWGKQRDCCLWEGVIYSNSTEQVSELYLSELFWQKGQNWQLNLSIFSSLRELRHLDLSWNSFPGPISSTSLAGLKKLKELDLSYNQFTGEIPTSLENLTSLEVLNLGYNFYLNGSFSFLKGLKKLKELDLSWNQFTGEIPTSLGYLISLEVLDLSRNDLIGSLPWKGFQELTNLQELYLEYNQFNGNLPPTLGNFTFLQVVDFSNNFLEGTVSKQLFRGLASLQYLDLSNNCLHGEFSLHSFANMSKLEGIVLSNNEGLEVDINSWSSIQQLQLRILMLSSCKLEKNAIHTPTFLCSQHHLEALDLSYNNLTGNIPTCLLNNNTEMEYLILGNNFLTGTIHLPSHQIESMSLIDVSENLFSGSLPSNISMVFPNLVDLNFSSNHLIGNIPLSFANISLLRILDLSDNYISGKIPSLNFTSRSFVYLGGNELSGALPSTIDRIIFLDVHDNDLSGLIPETLLDATELNALILRGNHFEGPIPQWLCNATNLYVLDLSNNSLSGSLPLCFPPGLVHLNLDNNALTGEIPNVLFNLSQLVALDIGKNHLSGPIPKQIGSEPSMQILILRENSFSGLVPLQLCNLQNLHILDLSYNYFSGPIPSCLGTMSFRFIDSQSFFPFLYSKTLLPSFYNLAIIIIQELIFWHARWAGDKSLRTCFPTLFKLATHKHSSVKRWMQLFASRDNFGFNNLSANDHVGILELASFSNTIRSNTPNTAKDELVWRWTVKGSYSSRSAYSFLVFDGIDDSRIPRLWTFKIPPRTKIFLWLAARNRLSTADRLSKKGWLGPSICVYCCSDGENQEHLFFRCSFARKVWRWTLQDNHLLLSTLLQEPGDLASRWRRTLPLVIRSEQDYINVCFAATCWVLWTERNHRIFDNQIANTDECGRRVDSIVSQWSGVLRG